MSCSSFHVHRIKLQESPQHGFDASFTVAHENNLTKVSIFQDLKLHYSKEIGNQKLFKYQEYDSLISCNSLTGSYWLMNWVDGDWFKEGHAEPK